METKIEWAEMTWNPVTGCSPVSEGCQNCYARRMANRLRGRAGYPPDDPFRVTFHEDRLEQPLHWRKPKRVFVCSMGDLFHEGLAGGEILCVWNRFLEADWHTYLVLTKRPERMAEWLKTRSVLQNVWLGVTAENQERFDERWAVLRGIGAAAVFVSYEPGLGPLVLPADFLARKNVWIICGGETGPGARAMCPQWPRGLLDQCVNAEVPFFFKGWGGVRKQKGNRLLNGREWNQMP